MKKTLFLLFCLLTETYVSAQFTVTLPNDTAICYGGCVFPTPKISGGTAPYSYTWNGTPVSSAPYYQCPPKDTIFTLIVSDSNSLIAKDTLRVKVNLLPKIILNSPKDTMCSNECLTLTASGGISYTWDPTQLISDTFIFCPSSPGTYSFNVTGQDSNDCYYGMAKLIIVNPAPTFALVPPSSSICKGNSIALFASGNSGTINSYEWFPASGLSSTTGSSVWAFPSITTTYTIVSKNSFGCTFTRTAVVIVQNCTNYIQGKVFIDLDSNCIQSSIDSIYKNKYIYAKNLSGFVYSNSIIDSNGKYKINVLPGTYEIWPQYDYTIYKIVCPSTVSYTISLPNSGDTAINKDFSLKHHDIVGISESRDLINIETLPNPFTDQTQFEVYGIETNIFSLIIYDAMGRTIKKIDKILSKKFTIDRSGIENGIYLFELRAENRIIGRGKLIVKWRCK